MSDMESPPTDHGSDRYDYVEISWPLGTQCPADPPRELWVDACPDCRANVFLTWDGQWSRTVAHDDGCPSFA